MNIREISDVFKDTADEITAIKSYNFGWASDRVRQGNTEDFQELNEFPRVFFAVPTITGSDQTRKQDTYQVTLFFDDLLGYDNEGDEDPTLQIDKWANLQQYANYFVQRLNKIKQSILPNYLFIPEAPSITFDSFTGIQRMITVQLSFNLVVPTNCDPGVITLVQCIANIVTSSNLTASLKSIIKFAASLEGRATLTADIALVQKVASSLNAFGTLTGDINFVQKVQASLLTSSSVTGNIIIPKLVQASLTGAGTTAANLTVNAPGLLLDLYPGAAVAYSLRKLRTAYTGSAIRVRRSSDNTEQDIGFVADQLDTVSLLAFCGVGNGFVARWYDQSGSGNNATQTTQAWQPQIVSSGSVIIVNNKPGISFTNTNLHQLQITNTIFTFTGNSTLFHVSRNRNNATLQYGGIIAQGPVSSQPGVTGNALAIQWQQYPNSATRATTDVYAPGGVSTNNTQNINTQYLATFQWQNWSTHKTNGNTIIAINGVNQALTAYGGNPSNFGTSTIYIGRTVDNNSASCFLGDIQEIVVYTTAFLQTNIDGAESNINTHYGIY